MYRMWDQLSSYLCSKCGPLSPNVCVCVWTWQGGRAGAVRGRGKSVRISHETYLQHCSPQRKNTEEEEEEEMRKGRPLGLEIHTPWWKDSVTATSFRFFYLFIYIYIFFLTFKLHPTSLVISRVIFKLAKNWMIIYQHTIYCKLSNKYIFCCSWEFFFSSFLSHFETKHQSCTATASNVNTGLLSNEAWSRLLLWHPHGTAEEFRKWAQATACCYGNTGSLINVSFVGGEKMGMNNLHIR